MRAVRFLMILAALTFVAVMSPSQAWAHISVDISLFHNSLAPYGRWVETTPYGLVWTPWRMAYGWRPYTYGHWVFTGDGWAWVSDEPWGWAVYHYGRWYLDPVYGWAWVPGPVWAPAWVAWRYGGGVIGWAPLPPEMGYDFMDMDFDRVIAPTAFSFVREPYFVDPFLTSHIYPASRNVGFVRITKNITRYRIIGGHVVNEGVRVARIEQVIGRRVPQLRIRDARSFPDARRWGIRGKEVAFFRPEVGFARSRPKEASFGATSMGWRSTLPRRQRYETQSLRAWHVTERSAMKRRHAQALWNAPRGERFYVARYNRAEMRMQRQNEMRQWNALQSRHRYERGMLWATHGHAPRWMAQGGGPRREWGHAPRFRTAARGRGGHGRRD